MQTTMQATDSNNIKSQIKPHYAWVDITRGLGIILVFYGHYLQRGVDLHNSSALAQFRFIYSFHMPLFFIVSGFFFRPSLQIFSRLRQLLLRRMIPVLVFGILLLPIWLRFEFIHSSSLHTELANMAVDYLDGRPELNWVTWFLVCLFMCEIMAVILLSRLHGFVIQILAGGLILGIGLLFCDYSVAPSDGWLYSVGRTWFLSEAFVALGFYTIGYTIFPVLKHLTENRLFAAATFLITITIVLLTYRLNHPSSIAVMMAAREHGNSFDFILTACAGSFAIFSLAILIQQNRLLQAVGRNSLTLLGLNGLFYHYIDPRLLHVIIPSNSQFVVTYDSMLVTFLSLLLCIPVVYFFNRYFPQLIGNIKVSGPLLPALQKQ